MNEEGYTHRQAADSLGISLSAMGRWARAERSNEPSSPAKISILNLTDQAEFTWLRRENEQLRMEQEILKNSPPGHRFPMQRNSLPLHWLNA